MAHSRFDERLGYARWLKHLVDGEAPAHSEIGQAVDRTGQAVSGWARKAEPPSDFRVHAPLAKYLAVDQAWLIEGAGEAPRAELWKAWLQERRRAPKVGLRPAKDGSAAKKRA